MTNMPHAEPMNPSYEVETALTEMDALNAALRAESAVDREAASDLVRAALRQAPEPLTIAERVVHTAMQKIVGQPINSCLLTATTDRWETYVEQTLSLAWIEWARGNDSREQMIPLMATPDSHIDSAVHMIVLGFWREAIVKLCDYDPTEARRMFKRALSLGASYGTESHRIVSWSFAASFIGERSPSGSAA